MPIDTAKYLQSLKLSPISQIGIVVKNIHEAAAYYGALLNIRKWYIPNVKSDECFYKGKAINMWETTRSTLLMAAIRCILG
jgi:hypothetical protein